MPRAVTQAPRAAALHPAWIWLAWLVTSCLFSSAAAEAYGYKSVWGGDKDVFFEHVIPVPLATGTLHWPCMLVVGALLGLALSFAIPRLGSPLNVRQALLSGRAVRRPAGDRGTR